MALPRPSIRQQVVAITALGVALRFVGLHQSIWHDEASTILLARMPLGQMLSSLPHIEASPPVYYVLLWAWGHLFGAGVATSRLLGVVIGLWVPAAIVIAAGFGAARAGRIGALLASALCAIGVVIVIAVAGNPTLQRADWAGVARAISQRSGNVDATTGRRLVVLENWLQVSPLQLYLPRLQPFSLPNNGIALSGVAEIDLVRAVQSASASAPPCWWGTPCIPYAAPPPKPNRLPGFRVVATSRIQEFVVIRMRAVGRPHPVTLHSLAAALSGLSPAASQYLSAPSLRS